MTSVRVATRSPSRPVTLVPDLLAVCFENQMVSDFELLTDQSQVSLVSPTKREANLSY